MTMGHMPHMHMTIGMTNMGIAPIAIPLFMLQVFCKCFIVI